MNHRQQKNLVIIGILSLMLAMPVPAQAAGVDFSGLVSIFSGFFNQVFSLFDKTTAAIIGSAKLQDETIRKGLEYTAQTNNDIAKKNRIAADADRYKPISKEACWNRTLARGEVAMDAAQDIAVSELSKTASLLCSSPESGTIINKKWLTDVFCALGTLGAVGPYSAEFRCDKKGESEVKFGHANLDQAILGKHCIPFDRQQFNAELQEMAKFTTDNKHDVINYTPVDANMRQALVAWLYIRMKLGMCGPKQRGAAMETLDGMNLAFHMVEDLNSRQGAKNPLYRAFAYVMCPTKEIAPGCDRDTPYIRKMLELGYGSNYFSNTGKGKYNASGEYCFSAFQRILAKNIGIQKALQVLGWNGGDAKDMSDKEFQLWKVLRDNRADRYQIMNNAAMALKQPSYVDSMPARPINIGPNGGKVENETPDMPELTRAIKSLTRALEAYHKNTGTTPRDVKFDGGAKKPAPADAVQSNDAYDDNRAEAGDALRDLGVKISATPLSSSPLPPLQQEFPIVK